MADYARIPMEGVREYAEGHAVYIAREAVGGSEHRLVVVAENQGRYDSTSVDLLDLLMWLRRNKPELVGGQAKYAVDLEASLRLAEILTEQGYMQYEVSAEVVHLRTKEPVVWENYEQYSTPRQKPVVVCFMTAISVGVGMKSQWDREAGA